MENYSVEVNLFCLFLFRALEPSVPTFVVFVFIVVGTLGSSVRIILFIVVVSDAWAERPYGWGNMVKEQGTGSRVDVLFSYVILQFSRNVVV